MNECLAVIRERTSDQSMSSLPKKKKNISPPLHSHDYQARTAEESSPPHHPQRDSRTYTPHNSSANRVLHKQRTDIYM